MVMGKTTMDTWRWALVAVLAAGSALAGCEDSAREASQEDSAEHVPVLEETPPHGGVTECLFGAHCANGGRCFQGFCVDGEALAWSDPRATVDVRPVGRWRASEGRIVLDAHETGVHLELEVLSEGAGAVPLLVLRSDEPQVPRQPRSVRWVDPGTVSWWVALEPGREVAVRVLAPGGVLSVQVARGGGAQGWEGELVVRTYAGRELLLPWRHFGALTLDRRVSWSVEEPWFLRGVWALEPGAEGARLVAPGETPAEGWLRRGSDGLWHLHIELRLHNGAETLTATTRLYPSTHAEVPPSGEPDAIQWPWTAPVEHRPEFCPIALRRSGAASVWEEIEQALEELATEDLRCEAGVCAWRALVCALDRLPDGHADDWSPEARALLPRALEVATGTLEAVQEADALFELLLRVGGFTEDAFALAPELGWGVPPWWSEATATTYWRILLGAWQRAARSGLIGQHGTPPTSSPWRVWDAVAAAARGEDPGALAVLLVALRDLDDAWRRSVPGASLPRVWHLSERLQQTDRVHRGPRPELDVDGVRRLAVDQRLEPHQGSWWQEEMQRAQLAIAAQRQEVDRLRHHLVQEVVGESERRERQQQEVLRHREEWHQLCGTHVSDVDDAREGLEVCGRTSGTMHRAWLSLLGALEAERRADVEQALHALRVDEKSRLLESQSAHHDTVFRLRQDGVERSLEALLHEDRLRRQAGRRASEGYPFWDALSWGASTGTALFGQAALLTAGVPGGGGGSGGGGAGAAVVGEAIDLLASTLQRRARRQREAEVRALQEQADRVQQERVRAERTLEVTILGLEQEERLKESAARLRLLLAESDRLAVQVEEARLQGLRAWHDLQAHQEEAERILRRWETMNGWSATADAMAAWRTRLGLQAVEFRRVERSGTRARRAVLRAIETVEAHLGARLPSPRLWVDESHGQVEHTDALERAFEELEEIALQCGRPGDYGELRISVRRDFADAGADHLAWPLDPGSHPPASTLRLLDALGVSWRSGWALPLLLPVDVSGLLHHGCAALIETVQVEVAGHVGPAPVVLIAHEGRGELRSCTDGTRSPVLAPPAVAVLEAGRASPGPPSMALAGRPMISGWTLLVPQDVAPNDSIDFSALEDWWITVGFRYRSPSGLPGCPLYASGAR